MTINEMLRAVPELPLYLVCAFLALLMIGGLIWLVCLHVLELIFGSKEDDT